MKEPIEAWVSTDWKNLTDGGSHAWKGDTMDGDDLGSQTAYLYYRFAVGNLSNYHYDSNAGRRTVQKFIST